MAKEFISRFGNDNVVSQVYDESNTTLNKLVVRGSNDDSLFTDPLLLLNDKVITDKKETGLNIVVLDNKLNFKEWKVYNLYDLPNSGNTFVVYMDSIPLDCIALLYSYDKLKSSPVVDAYMKKIGSVVWSDERHFELFPRNSYSAIYSPKMRRIITENLIGDDIRKTNDTRSYVEIVFDSLNDIALDGVPFKEINDYEEYKSSPTDYGYKTWSYPNTYGDEIKAGDIFYLEAEIKSDKELIDNGGNTYLFLFSAYTSGVWVDSLLLKDTGKEPDVWHKVSGYYVVPNDAEIKRTSTGCYKFPSSLKKGISSVRNVMQYKVSSDVRSKVLSSIGVNGIANDGLIEVDETTNLLELPLTDNTLISNSFDEIDYFLYDVAEYQSTDATYQIKNYFRNTDTPIDSVGVNVGDTIEISALSFRDKTAYDNKIELGLILEFYNKDGNWIAGKSSFDDTGRLSSNYNKYEQFTSDIVVPAGTTNISAGVFRMGSKEKTGLVKIKDCKLFIKGRA